jgi:hypothetical protein
VVGRRVVLRGSYDEEGSSIFPVHAPPSAVRRLLGPARSFYYRAGRNRFGYSYIIGLKR